MFCIDVSRPEHEDPLSGTDNNNRGSKEEVDEEAKEGLGREAEKESEGGADSVFTDHKHTEKQHKRGERKQSKKKQREREKERQREKEEEENESDGGDAFSFLLDLDTSALSEADRRVVEQEQNNVQRGTEILKELSRKAQAEKLKRQATEIPSGARTDHVNKAGVWREIPDGSYLAPYREDHPDFPWEFGKSRLTHFCLL
jgi:hypothetical protein